MVGGGTVGAWCAYFLRKSGLDNVVLVEKGLLGQGASSRAAGVVRLQGGTPEAVRLGRWTRDFYLRQRAEIGTDSGFARQGYLLPCFTDAEVAAARTRIAMQQAEGIPVRWARARTRSSALNPTMAPGQTLGGTLLRDDGYIDPPRNVLRLHRGPGHAPASTYASTPPLRDWSPAAPGDGRRDEQWTGGHRRRSS